MKIQNLCKIIKWANKYQPNLTQEEGKELYYKLCDEEIKELEKAKEEKNLIEILDGVGDVLWVYVLFVYFSNSYINYVAELYDNIILIVKKNLEFNVKVNGSDEVLKNLELNVKEYGLYEVSMYLCLDEVLEEIIKSNFTKSLELQTEGKKIGKVIKGPNFVKPDFSKIIEKYNIKLKN